MVCQEAEVVTTQTFISYIMQTVLITGGTGLVGKKLCGYLLEKKYNVIILSRNPGTHQQEPGLRYAGWDINSGKIDIKAVQEADFIIHLAGAPVMEKRWTAAYKKEIADSRIKSSLLLADTLQNNPHHVQSIISSSAIGWYGPDKNTKHAFVESDPPAADFLGQTCLQWEESIERAEQHNVRVCKLRTGIVLAEKGGALEEFIKPLNFGVATILGNGKQVISWIHVDDLCNMFHHVMTNSLRGSYNAVAPEPVSNKKLVLSLAKLMKKNAYIPVHVPTAALKLILGERSIEILKSATVSSQKIIDAGFTFRYPDIDSALLEITENIR